MMYSCSYKKINFSPQQCQNFHLKENKLLRVTKEKERKNQLHQNTGNYEMDFQTIISPKTYKNSISQKTCRTVTTISV